MNPGTISPLESADPPCRPLESTKAGDSTAESTAPTSPILSPPPPATSTLESASPELDVELARTETAALEPNIPRTSNVEPTAPAPSALEPATPPALTPTPAKLSAFSVKQTEPVTPPLQSGSPTTCDAERAALTTSDTEPTNPTCCSLEPVESVPLHEEPAVPSTSEETAMSIILGETVMATTSEETPMATTSEETTMATALEDTAVVTLSKEASDTLIAEEPATLSTTTLETPIPTSSFQEQVTGTHLSKDQTISTLPTSLISIQEPTGQATHYVTTLEPPIPLSSSQVSITSSVDMLETSMYVTTPSIREFTTNISTACTLPLDSNPLACSLSAFPLPSPSPSLPDIEFPRDSPAPDPPFPLSCGSRTSSATVGIFPFEEWTQSRESTPSAPRMTIKTGRCLDPALYPCFSWADTAAGGDTSIATTSCTAIKTVLVYPPSTVTPRKALRTEAGDTCASAAAVRCLRTKSKSQFTNDFGRDVSESKEDVLYCPATPRRALRFRNAVPCSATTHGRAIKTESWGLHGASVPFRTFHDGGFAVHNISSSLFGPVKTKCAVTFFTASPRPPIKNVAFLPASPRPPIKKEGSATFFTVSPRRSIKQESTFFGATPWRFFEVEGRSQYRRIEPCEAIQNKGCYDHDAISHSKSVFCEPSVPTLSPTQANYQRSRALQKGICVAY
ncbi:mucin-2-like [Penaeus chinensis]|uniref:mucin-2-like n=1 Tax=Penaeus chinensis TaxID=139456 RepID=UPI001FB78D6C|nr:mucin-2-like [Penaeus chinensis]